MADSDSNELFTPNEAYTLALPIWQKCRDTSTGEDALHARDLESPGTYLRPLNPANKLQANIAKNKAYVLMARFQNFVGSTKSGFMGMAYNSKPVMPVLPERMSYLIDNVNGVGLSLEQQSRKTLSEVVEVGRDGLLCEMPQNDGEITIAQEQAGMRPSIVTYLAESIIDWYPYEPSASRPLQYVVLKECDTRKVDGKFETENITIYRVLHLNDDGNYHQTVYESDKDGEIADRDGVTTQIFAANNQPMKEIPFTFVGSITNTPEIDKPVILDIANACLGMYQEDANLRVSSFGFSAGTMTIADDKFQSQLTSNDPEKPNAVAMGDGQALVMGTSGKAEIIVPPNNPLAAKIKETDQKNVIELGAQAVMPSGGVTSVVEVESRNAVNSSKLTVAVENTSDAYNQQLMWCADFLGVDLDLSDDNKFAISTEFFSAKLTPEEVAAVIASFHGALISKSVAQGELQRAGNIPASTDLEAMNVEIDETPANAINFDETE